MVNAHINIQKIIKWDKILGEKWAERWAIVASPILYCYILIILFLFLQTLYKHI